MNMEIYEVLVRTVITLYDCGILTAEMLSGVMVACRGLVVGGMTDLLAKDGLSFEQIICKLMAPTQYSKIGSCPVPASNTDHTLRMQMHIDWERKIHILCHHICMGHWEFDLHGTPERYKHYYACVRHPDSSGPPSIVKIRVATDIERNTVWKTLENGFHQSAIKAGTVSEAVAHLRRELACSAEIICPDICIDMD